MMMHTRMNTCHPISSPLSTISATLALQSSYTSNVTHHPFLQPQECSPDTSMLLYPSLLPDAPFESDFQSNGIMDTLSHLATSPRPFVGLGIRCTESTSFYKPDLLSTGEYLSMDIQAVSSDPYNGLQSNNDSLHLSLHTLLPHYDSSGFLMDFDDPNATVITYPENCMSPHWSSGLPPSRKVSGTFSYPFSLFMDSSPPLHERYQVPSTLTPPMVPPIPDINMFELAMSKQIPSAGVNPADTVTLSGPEDWKCGDTVSLSSPANSLSPFGSPPSGVMSTDMIDEILSIISASATTEQAPPTIDDSAIKVENDTNSISAFEVNTAPLLLPKIVDCMHSLLSPTLKSSVPSPFSSPRKEPTGILNPTGVAKTAQRRPVKVQEDHLPLMGTPVLDAHHGVLLVDLRAKAERYRQRNLGEEIDKRWLNSFAGKLSERGELLDDFRCYVIGCSQTNKRRDHILIHVGSHVDQRPFLCGHCPMRFLRKNECKRHEASHTGDKPYVCDICPFEEKAFVRLDLLRRHLKRAHAIHPSANKENDHRSSKRAKLGC